MKCAFGLVRGLDVDRDGDEEEDLKRRTIALRNHIRKIVGGSYGIPMSLARDLTLPAGRNPERLAVG